MKFKKFASIENHYRQKYLAILNDRVPTQMWYSREKIHGANFSFITDGDTVRVASRTQFVDSGFYNCSEVIEKYASCVRLFKNEHYPNASEIQLYGELFGKGIQAGVNYGDNKDFMAFDLRVDDTIVAINPDTASVLRKYAIHCAPLIGVYNNLEDALKESNEFPSRVATALYGTAINDDNTAEGLVLQPMTSTFLSNGSRVLIKSKGDKWTEKNKRKGSDSKTSVANPFTTVAEQYVNQNRLDAVLSKLGDISPNDFGKVIKLLSEDVIIDMIKDDDLPEDWRKQDEFKLAGKGVMRAVSTFLKTNLLPKL